jgi:hypothetical protein
MMKMKRVDVQTSFSAKITSYASSPFFIIITVLVTCTPTLSLMGNNTQEMSPKQAATLHGHCLEDNRCGAGEQCKWI